MYECVNICQPLSSLFPHPLEGEDPLAVAAPPEPELSKPETPPQAKNKKRLDEPRR